METAGRRLAAQCRAAPPQEHNQRSLAASLVLTTSVLMAKSTLKNEQPASADEVVRLAEEAVQAHPCVISNQTLIGACLYRTHAQLIRSNRDYQRLAEQFRPLLSPYETLIVGLLNKTARQAIVAHADFRRVAELTKANLERFPNTGSPDEWLI